MHYNAIFKCASMLCRSPELRIRSICQCFSGINSISATMEDVHSFVGKPYVAADRLQRETNLPHQIWSRCNLAAMVITAYSVGIWKSIVAWLRPVEPKDIRGQVALVTGGANGLGRAISIELAKHGCHVAICDLDIIGASGTCEELRSLGVKAEPYQVDVTDNAQIINLRGSIENDLGPVDILVNNAGIIAGVPMHGSKPEDFRRIIDVNLAAHAWTILAFMQGMTQRGRGHIVAVSSILGWNGIAGAVGYCATKYGVRGLMDALVAELRCTGSPVNVTTVYPSYINTRKEMSGLFKKLNDENNLLKEQINTPEEVATAIIDGLRQNRRHVFMNNFAWLWCITLSILPTILHDTLIDFGQPSIRSENKSNA